MYTWKFIDSGSGSAQWNMAVDEALLYTFRENDLPILRLYRWERPSLSFGRFSHPAEVMNLHEIERSEASYVRRITGGGILVHGGDISYSLVVPRSFVEERGVKESYRHLCGFLIKLYRDLGLDAAFAHELQMPETKSPVCLAGTEAYDIIIGGRKIGGNAQRHARHALMQHGTVPLWIDTERFEALFQEETGLSRAATLQQNGVHITEEKLTAALMEAFETTYDVMLGQDTLSSEEEELAKKLFYEKYSKDEWNVHAQIQQT